MDGILLRIYGWSLPTLVNLANGVDEEAAQKAAYPMFAKRWAPDGRVSLFRKSF